MYQWHTHLILMPRAYSLQCLDINAPRSLAPQLRKTNPEVHGALQPFIWKMLVRGWSFGDERINLVPGSDHGELSTFSIVG
mmetsp:Transcript_17919/g.44984  ORF Transcript_17919/g.44984 Transcript_17919/m.44984 type:complete len:81 (-) Transcript_17919:98-340(-)